MAAGAAQEEEDNRTPEEKQANMRPRKCTDPWCLPIFGVALFFLVYILHYASLHGDMRRVFHGLDFQNNLCGVSAGVEDKPFLYWCTKSGSAMDLSALTEAGIAHTITDEAGSPISLTGLHAVLTATNNLDLAHPICVQSCPTGFDTFSSCFLHETFEDTSKDVTGTFSRNITYHFGFVEDHPSYTLGKRYCLPSDNVMLEQLADTLTWGAESAMFHLFEVLNSWTVILGAGFAAFLLGYLYLFLVTKIAGPVVYATFALATLFCCGFGGYMLLGIFAQDFVFRLEDSCVFCTEDDVDEGVAVHFNSTAAASELFVPMTGIREADMAISILLLVLGAAIGIAGCCMKESIELVLGSLEATVECLQDMPILLLQPLVSGILRVLYLSVAFVGFAWVASVGDVATWDVSSFVPTGLTRSFTYQDDEMFYVAGYCFVAVWILELGRALDQTMLAYATQMWFFAPYVGGKKSVSIFAILRGLVVGLTYHLGTLTFGSLLLALFQVLYFVLSVIYKQAKTTNEDGTVNKVAGCAAGCCLCCLKCWESVVRYMNKNVYTVVTLNSVHFCTAAETVVKVMVEDFAALGLLEGVTKVFQFGGVVTITGVGSYLTWLVLRNVGAFTDPASVHAVPQPEVVTVAAGALCFSIAMIFMNVFDVISDTVLLCWSLDRRYRKENGLGKNPNLPSRLKDLLDKVIGDPLIE